MVHRKLRLEDTAELNRLWTDGMSPYLISKELGVSYDEVRKWVKQLELVTDGSDIQDANRRRAARNAKKRHEIAERALDEALVSQDMLHREMDLHNWHQGVMNTATIDEPTVTARKVLLEAVETAVKTALRITQYDRDTMDALPAVDAWLDDITGLKERGETYVEHIDQSGETE
jgi:transposase